MLKPEIANALNKQLSNEFSSAYIYLAMSMRCQYLGLEGAANWFNVQYQEEMSHVDKFCDYMNMHGAEVILGAIEKPVHQYNDLLELFDATLKHEQYITSCINNLVQVAREHGDYATEVFLQWYITEQVEEESNVNAHIDKLKLIGQDGSALYMIDQELGRRIFTPPAK